MRATEATLAPDCAACAGQAHCALLALARDSDATPALREVRVAAGRPALHSGQRLDAFVVIKVGAVVLRRPDPLHARPRAIAVLGRGQLLGARAWLGEPVAVDAHALGPTRACQLPFDALRGRGVPPGELPRAAAEGLVRVADTLADWAAAARLPDVEQRLHAALHLLQREQGTHTVTLPARADLAALSGCAPETASRALAALQRRGVWQRRGRCVVAGAAVHPELPAIGPNERPK